MDERIWKAALAGLLHDIGKFAQRAGIRGSRSWDETAQKDFKYYYAVLTADFIDKYIPESWRVPIKNAAGNHHRPSNRIEWALALADHLSAGERADPPSEARAAQPKQLLSIFCSLTSDGYKTPQDVYWPLNVLDFHSGSNKESLFPGEAWDESRVWKAYEGLWESFCMEAGQLRDIHHEQGNPSIYLESLLYLMQRYTWSIPSAYYRSRPDISLYDHDRMTAALAAVLVGSELSDEVLKNLSSKSENEEENLALLVGGDISGIQEFIYTISARGAASALRGRSFYIQLLTDAAARYMLDRLELPATNLIYASGGHFYILARPNDQLKLTEIQKEISKALLYHHRGDLYLATASIPLKGRDFYHGKIGQSWGQLSDRLQQAKQRRFSDLEEDLSALFLPQGHGGNLEKQCQVCGSEHPDTQADAKGHDPDKEVRKCPQCVSYERLGEMLRQSEYLVLERIPASRPPEMKSLPVPGNWEEVISTLGLRVQLHNLDGSLHQEGYKERWIFALSEQALHKLSNAGDAFTVVGRRFLVNVTPTITEKEIAEFRKKGARDLPVAESTKPFHILEAEAEGIPRLGVLRADVDGMGEMFSQGLGDSTSLSRVASLSFAISLYFEGWVEVLGLDQNKADLAARGKEKLYSIYSGGDDLFFVGAWDVVVEFARKVRTDLYEFAAYHPGVHLSAGIALVDGKYPLYQAAQEAQSAEDHAKHLQWLDNGVVRKKDAVSFLGQAMPWKKFGLEDCSQKDITTAHALMHLLVDERDKGAATPLIRRLIGLHERYQEALEKRRRRGEDQNRSGQEQALWGPWNWLGYYSLSRLYRQSRDEDVKSLRDELKAADFRNIEWIGLAARWAELIQRK
jgi:CRISPR-associated protein Csm1